MDKSGAALPGVLGNFFAFDPRFLGGVFVATGDVNGDGRDDMIVSAGAGRRSAREGLQRQHRRPVG